MAQRPLDPSVADEAPHATALTGYDEQHAITYLRLLDAEAEGADWTEVARSSAAQDDLRHQSHQAEANCDSARRSTLSASHPQILSAS
jgi:hypothetical protein